MTLNEWTDRVRTELGIDIDVDVDLVLDLARDAAHGIARPAAPLTTFLLGYAAATTGDTAATAARIQALIDAQAPTQEGA